MPGLKSLAGILADQPLIAVDTESNSLYAYREQVCLIQFSTPLLGAVFDLHRPVADQRLQVVACGRRQRLVGATVAAELGGIDADQPHMPAIGEWFAEHPATDTNA